MNATSAFGAAAVVAFSLAAVPAHAFMSSKVVATPPSSIAKVDFVQGHEIVAGIPAREFARAQASKDMAQRYFDVDVVVTLGALAIASGAFVAAGLAGGRRRAAPAPQLRATWRQDVIQAVEADLISFADGLRRAA